MSSEIPRFTTDLPESMFPGVWKFLSFLNLPSWGFPGGSEFKVSASNVGDPGLILGLGRSPGEGNGNPLQYYDLENPMDGGAW